jgi:hypothetical protein
MGKLEIQLQKVATPEEADRIGFGGSPTILFDGVDLFADASPSVGYACRPYRTAAGAEGAPSLSQLTERLAEAWQRWAASADSNSRSSLRGELRILEASQRRSLVRQCTRRWGVLGYADPRGRSVNCCVISPDRSAPVLG